jgi:hypothetical protein
MFDMHASFLFILGGLVILHVCAVPYIMSEPGQHRIIPGVPFYAQ